MGESRCAVWHYTGSWWYPAADLLDAPHAHITKFSLYQSVASLSYTKLQFFRTSMMMYANFCSADTLSFNCKYSGHCARYRSPSEGLHNSAETFEPETQFKLEQDILYYGIEVTYECTP